MSVEVAVVMVCVSWVTVMVILTTETFMRMTMIEDVLFVGYSVLGFKLARGDDVSIKSLILNRV